MKAWTLYLVFPGRYGPLASGAAMLTMWILIQLWLVGELFWASTGLFFAAALAYLPAVHAHIFNLTRAAVVELSGEFALSPAQQSAALDRVQHPGWRYQIIFALIGTCAGVMHIEYMGLITQLPDGSMDLSSNMIKVNIAGTLLSWVTMTTVIANLVRSNSMLGDLAKYFKQVDLFRKQPWQPLARVAIASTLALIGTNALFPLLFIDSGTSSAVKILPGMMLTAPAIIAMVMLPLSSAHKLIVAHKTQRLEAIDHALRRLTNPKSMVDMQGLNTLLAQRTHLEKVSTWPLNLDNVGRLLFYLFIPPLTWVGAALIERLVDGIV